ncbi:unnamed protein product [Schistosoma margrebowiei]|uniref:Phosphoinositide phospholipase C n=1 Tax=Schistosoma margrebowiei TaxID=48269 RepID=A0AA85A6B2_9TREM|nr:unnamed protein product [Schistosoma margrebowiei]
MNSHNQIEMKHPIQLLKNLSSDFSIKQKYKTNNKFMSSINPNELMNNSKCISNNNNINNKQSHLQCTIDKTQFIMKENHKNITVFHNPYHHHHHSIPNISNLVKNNVNHLSYTNTVSCEGYSQDQLNHIPINDHVDEQISSNNTSKILYKRNFYKKYHSLQNLIPSNQQIHLEHQTYSLSKFNYSSFNTISLQTNIHCLKQMYQSQSTYVIVCEYPINLSVRYMGNNYQIPNINLIELSYLWHHIGWGYLIAIANRNDELPNSFDSITLILCQPITFKQLWIGYIVIPDKIDHYNIINKSLINSDLVQSYIKQIHKNLNDKFYHTHCIVMKLNKDTTYNMVQMKQKQFKSHSILKSIFQRLFNKLSKTKNQFISDNNIFINNKHNFEYCICKIESIESGINDKIHQQSMEFFSELDKLISNSIVFHLQPESEKQLAIERQRNKYKLGLSTLQSNTNSSECIKNQISFPCLFRHIYSLSRDDLQTMRTIYGFEV